MQTGWVCLCAVCINLLTLTQHWQPLLQNVPPLAYNPGDVLSGCAESWKVYLTCCAVMIVQCLQSAPPSSHGTIEAFAAKVESGRAQRRVACWSAGPHDLIADIPSVLSSMFGGRTSFRVHAAPFWKYCWQSKKVVRACRGKWEGPQDS